MSDLMVVGLLAVFLIYMSISNRWRGGFPEKPDWLPGRLLLWSGVLNTIVIFVISAAFGLSVMISGVFALAVFAGYMAGFSPGWGSYYDIGTNAGSFRDSSEVKVIDWILCKLHGPQWIPSGFDPAMYIRFDNVVSPTGDVRPYSWRIQRDFTGMCLRGLLAGIGMTFVPAIVLGLMGVPDAWYLMVMSPFWMWMGPIYYFANHIWFKLPGYEMNLPGGDKLYETSIAERITGILNGIGVLLMILILL